jgi:hypothetical protein
MDIMVIDLEKKLRRIVNVMYEEGGFGTTQGPFTTGLYGSIHDILYGRCLSAPVQNIVYMERDG